MFFILLLTNVRSFKGTESIPKIYMSDECSKIYWNIILLFMREIISSRRRFERLQHHLSSDFSAIYKKKHHYIHDIYIPKFSGFFSVYYFLLLPVTDWQFETKYDKLIARAFLKKLDKERFQI